MITFTAARRSPSEPAVSRATGGPSFPARRIGIVLGGRRVLDDLDLHVAPGTTVPLLGPNEAGAVPGIMVIRTQERS